jgi:hypothetical protein
MFIYTTHTTSTTKRELQQSCNNIFLPFRHLFYVCFLTLTPTLPLLVGEGRKEWGKRNDSLFIPNSTISQTISLTKDIPCGIPAKVMPGRRELFNHKPKFNLLCII